MQALSALTRQVSRTRRRQISPPPNLRVSSLDCTGYANGGTLTTDASGNVLCATDDGGVGSSVAGSDTQVQFNSGGGFAAAASFTFSSSSGRLAVSYASTTAFTALGTGYFGTASTTNLTISGLPTTLLSTDINGAAQSTTVSSPLSFSGSILSIAQASSTANGYLSSADWTAFSQKFATTSSDNWIAQYGKGFFFSTTSTDAWDATKARWSTSSALGFEATQWRWATTSSDYWDSTKARWATTSQNAWEATQSRWATSSASYFKSTQTRWATTSTDYWESRQARWATTSSQYFESTQWRWATSSADYFESTQTRWATTSSDYWLTQNRGQAFSTTSANAFLSTKSTDDIAQGSANKYYATALFATDLAGTTTDALREGGTNKYFTDARADARINATSSIGTLTSAPNLSTLATTLSGFLKATAGALSTAAINLASDITGILPVGNGGTGWANIAASAIPYGSGSGALATTTAGTGGYVLAYLNGVPGWTATTTFSAPLSYSGGAVSISAANGLTNGYLTSADWTTFDSKQSALLSGTNIKTING